MNEGLRWYVAHTYSGYENKVKANLEKIVENRGLGHLITDIRIPTEIVVESDGGKEREVENKVFPAYVLIKMVMTDESWHVVRNIRGVTGFVGPGSKPVPLTNEEAAAIIKEDVEITESTAFNVGDKVNIIDGVFRGYSGTLSEFNNETGEVTVIVSTVGRDIPVKLDKKLVERAAE
ncbi:MAG: transcription termination/antitermination factor NusG [Ruminococcaceae bacterium]|nr:transcription termination/antitermination factor NusG [Oscillospiraceae bacterium]